MNMNYYQISAEELGKNAKVPLLKLGDSGEVFYEIALEMVNEIEKNNAIGRRTVFICPVGPVGQYPIFVRLVNERRLSLKNCWFINMDEYLTDDGEWIDESSALSFHGFMNRTVYSKIDPELVMPENQRIFPDPHDPDHIAKVIDELGGVDIAFGGIGINGHLAFNESQDELTPEVADKDITVHRVFDSKDDVPESMKGSNYVRTMRDEIVSLISYAVGCMFGRYSPTYDGLAYAGGTWDDGKYNIYKPDADGIIPICDDEYFEDDMVGRFVEFVRVVYGDSSLEDNLRFIANALGGKGQPKEVIRNYFLNDFYADHCKIYQKRPIYWLFDSGKKNGFKCLIYLHRYQPDTIARIRTDYVHEQQARYRTAIEGLEKQVAAATSTSERVKLTKQLNKVQAQDNELHQYEEKVHALADQMIKIDLDDGVKHNYEIFKDVLAKIK